MLNPHAPCALFFDYDGTLAYDGIVSEENRQALRRLQAAGHKIFLNTGRSKVGIPPEMLAFSWNGLIAGASYVELEGEILSDATLPRECLQAIFEIHQRLGVRCYLEGVTQLYCLGNDRWHPDVADTFPALLRDHYEEMHISKCSLWDLVDQVVQEPTLQAYSVVRQGDIVAEIAPAGIDKGYGVSLIAQKLGLSRDQLVAFGDSGNDLAMLRSVGTGVIMPHAPKELEPYAALRTQNGSTGVAEAIQTLFFKETVC